MATAQLSFFSSVSSFAKPFVKADAATKDPLVAAKVRFAAVADETVRLINEGKDKGFWFRKIGDGYVVQLKNGAAVLKDCAFAVGTAKDAVKLIEAAKRSAAVGEFDAMFTATARAPRKAKVEAAAPDFAREPATAPAPAMPQIAPVAAAKSKRK